MSLLQTMFLAFLFAPTIILAVPNLLPEYRRDVFPYATISAPSTPPVRQVRADCQRVGVTIYEDVDWKGPRTFLYNCVGGAPEQCTVLDGMASSIGPEVGFHCNFYRANNCQDTPGDPNSKLTLRYPGEGFLTNIGWNDTARSYQCFKD